MRAKLVIALTVALVTIGGTAAAEVPHTVEPGETLWTIAYASNFETQALAAYNGLSPDAQLVAGTTIMIPSVAEARSAVASSVSQPTSSAGGNFSSPAEVGEIAAEEGFAPALPSAIAYMESGFNQDAVSPAGARGVMQVLPSTFDWVNESLSDVPLDPNSRTDNIRAGMSYLHYLWHETGQNVEQTVASYYQGLASVQETGLYAETERYVDDVLALRERFAP